jgi:hypothetical protein
VAGGERWPIQDPRGQPGADPQQKKQIDTLVELANQGAQGQPILFHTADRDAYADLEINGHRETWPVRSRVFKQWLTRQFFERTGTAPNPAALASAILTCEAQANFKSPQREVFVRIAGSEKNDGAIYLDLCDKHWRAVRIDAEGWQLVKNPRIRFIRRKGMRALPVPVEGGSIAQLRPFINVAKRGDFVLIVSWLLAALRHRGPYPVLFVWGEQGSAKSSLIGLLRDLVDPNSTPLRTPPRDNRDLFIAATNAYVPTFDNLSSLPDWLSDSLCRLATGGGFATRLLYTDDEERLFEGQRPILLNGIENVITRGDLADRALVVKLSHISKKQRRPEKKFWQQFARAKPQILGALLTAVARGLKVLPEIELADYPRMADFAEWMTACEHGLWQPGTFAAAYDDNRQSAGADVVEADLVATTLQSFITHHRQWTGTATKLHQLLEDRLDDRQKASPAWPKAANALAGRLTRSAPDLRKLGIEIGDRGRDPVTRRRLITISLGNPPERSFGSFHRSNPTSLKDLPSNDPNDRNDLSRTSPSSEVKVVDEIMDVDDEIVDQEPEAVEIIDLEPPPRSSPRRRSGFVFKPDLEKRTAIVRKYWLESQQNKKRRRE